MTYFRVTADSSALACPIEKIVDMAVKADFQVCAIRILHGNRAVIKVWDAKGLEIGPGRLASLVKAEQDTRTALIRPLEES